LPLIRTITKYDNQKSDKSSTWYHHYGHKKFMHTMSSVVGSVKLTV